MTLQWFTRSRTVLLRVQPDIMVLEGAMLVVHSQLASDAVVMERSKLLGMSFTFSPSVQVDEACSLHQQNTHASPLTLKAGPFEVQFISAFSARACTQPVLYCYPTILFLKVQRIPTAVQTGGEKPYFWLWLAWLKQLFRPLHNAGMDAEFICNLACTIDESLENQYCY